ISFSTSGLEETNQKNHVKDAEVVVGEVRVGNVFNIRRISSENHTATKISKHLSVCWAHSKNLCCPLIMSVSICNKSERRTDQRV
ncbi:hypothetical protein C5167_018377, partial [Papaver somniferum]